MSRNVSRVKRSRGFKVHHASVYSNVTVMEEMMFSFSIAHAFFCSHQTEEPSASSIWRLPRELLWSFWRTLSVQREFQGPSSSFPLIPFFLPASIILLFGVSFNSDGAGGVSNRWFLIILVISIILRQTAPTNFTSDLQLWRRREISAVWESKTFHLWKPGSKTPTSHLLILSSLSWRGGLVLFDHFTVDSRGRFYRFISKKTKQRN